MDTRDVTDSKSASESDGMWHFLKSDRNGFKTFVSVQLYNYFRKYQVAVRGGCSISNSRWLWLWTYLTKMNTKCIVWEFFVIKDAHKSNYVKLQ